MENLKFKISLKNELIGNKSNELQFIVVFPKFYVEIAKRELNFMMIKEVFLIYYVNNTYNIIIGIIEYHLIE